MRHRDLVSLREFREAETQREAAAKEQRERKEAAARAKREAARLADQQSIAKEFHRELILEGAQDSHFLVSITPEMLSIRMSVEEAERFNREQADLFIKQCPEYAAYKSNATFQQLSSYLEQNGARIVSAEMLRVAFERLKSLGIILPNPKPKPAPAPKAVNLTIEKPAYGDRVNGGVLGRDWATGNDRIFTDRELDRMSSTEFRRAVPVVQTVSELLTTMSNNRI